MAQGTKTTEQLLPLIQNLLKKTTENGCTEAEASAALNKVQDLLFRYDLDMATVTEFTPGEADFNEIVGRNYQDDTLYCIKDGGKNSEWKVRLGFAFGNYSLCKVLSSGTYMRFIGRKVDVAVTKEMYGWVIEQCEALATQALNDFQKTKVYYRGLSTSNKMVYDIEHPNHEIRSHGGKWKNNFLHGMTVRIVERLRDHWNELKTQDAQSTAMVLVSEGAIQDYIKEQFPRLGTRRVATKLGAGTRAGYAAGSKVALNKNQQLANSLQLH